MSVEAKIIAFDIEKTSDAVGEFFVTRPVFDAETLTAKFWTKVSEHANGRRNNILDKNWYCGTIVAARGHSATRNCPNGPVYGTQSD